MGANGSKGKEFVPRSICAVCKNRFYCAPCYKKRGGRAGTFCSVKCRGIADRVRNEETHKELRIKKAQEKSFRSEAKKQKLEKPVKPCKHCGLPTIKPIFCNRYCYVSYKKIHAGNNSIPIKCKNCSKITIQTPGILNSGFGKFCSLSCAHIYRVKNAKHSIYGNSKGGKRADLEDMYFRSRWEANYARYLNCLMQRGGVMRWEYEPKTFHFDFVDDGIHSYTPDFMVEYINGDCVFIEIKGYLDEKSKIKLSKMQKQYPNVEIELLGNRAYKELSKRMQSVIPNWELDTKKRSQYV